MTPEQVESAAMEILAAAERQRSRICQCGLNWPSLCVDLRYGCPHYEQRQEGGE